MKCFSLKKIFYNDQRLKLFSIIIAILFWIVVVANVSPECTKTIGGVKLDRNVSADFFSGYKIIDADHDTVNVQVTGPRFLVGRLSARDFEVRPRNQAVTSAGRVNAELDVSLAQPDYRIKIKKVTPSSATLFLDKVSEKKMPVTVQVQNAASASGYLLQPAVSDPSEITVTGPQSLLSKLTGAVAQIRSEDNLTADVSAQSDIVLYEADGKKADMKYLTMSTQKAKVTIPVYKEADIPLKVNFINVPSWFDKTNLSCVIKPGTVKAAAESGILDDVGSINLGDVDFMRLSLQNTYHFTFTLPAGVLNVGPSSAADVDVSLNNISQKTFTVRKFTAVNLPDGYRAYIKTSRISNVVLYGPSDGIGAVTELQAVIDMSKASASEGNKIVPVTIRVPGDGYWITEQYNALVYLYRYK